MLKSSMCCISPLEWAATCDSSLVVFVFVLPPCTLDIKLVCCLFSTILFVPLGAAVMQKILTVLEWVLLVATMGECLPLQFVLMNLSCCGMQAL